jgi:hypothetical protein
MPKDFKKAFLEEQNAKIKTELEITALKKELEDLKKNQVYNQFQPQQQIYPQNNPVQEPVSQFESDVRYIVGLCQRMSVVMRKCRQQMLPMSLGKEIDILLRELDKL